jgi:hypothetical protein
MRSCTGIQEVIRNLEAKGTMVNGRHHAVPSCVGGELKLVNEYIGLCGCSLK